MIAPPWRARLLALAAVTAGAVGFGLCARLDRPWMPLDWVALAPWLAVLDRARSLRGAVAAGMVFSVAFTLAVTNWFASAIETYAGVPWAAGMAALAILAPLLQPQFVAFAVARHAARRRLAGGPAAVIGACIYVGTEWLMPKLFGDTLGHGLYPSALMRQAADLAGAAGLTFAIVIANECVLAIVRSIPLSNPRSGAGRAFAPAACLGGIVFGLLGYGAVRHAQVDSRRGTAEPVTAGIVQADISRYGRLAERLGTFEAVRTILDTHFALSSDLLGRASLDFLVWPETVYPTTFGSPKSPEGADFDGAIGAFVARAGLPLVFGAYDTDGTDEYNAAVFLEPSADGRLSFDTYRKVWLFPLTERPPAWLDFALARRWLPWLGGWKPGPGPEVMQLSLREGRTLRIAPLICYDTVHPGHTLAAVRQGADLILTLSNDSWFAFGSAARGHLVLSAFRSLETRRPQLRATPTGISAVISPTGELVKTIGVNERAALAAAIEPAPNNWTLMLAWGDWFGPAALAAAGLTGAFALRRSAPPGSRR